MDAFGWLGSAFTVVVLIGGLLQGIAAGLDLLDRWKTRKLKVAKTTAMPVDVQANVGTATNLTVGKSTPASTPRKTRLTQQGFSRLLFLIPFYGFLPHFILVTSTFYNTMQSWVIILTILLYSYFYVYYPFLMWKTKDSGTQRFLQFAFACLCILWAVAGTGYGYDQIRQTEWYKILGAISHGVTFTVIRFSLLHYFAVEVIRPWYKTLPEN